MSTADDGFSQFTVAGAAELKKSVAVGKVKARRSVAAEASGKNPNGGPVAAVLAEAPKQQLPAPEPSLAKRPVSRETAKRVLGVADADATADESERTLAVKKYRGYWQSPHTRPFCADVAPNSNWSLVQAKGNLDRVRDTCNAQQSLDLTAHVIEYGLRGLTYITHDMGINPRGWTLRDNNGTGVADVFRVKKEGPEFQPSLSEVGAEAGMTVTSNCYSRLGFALFDLCEGFSRAAQNKATASS